MLYNVGSRMLLTSWKSYVVRCGKSNVVLCGKSYIVTKLEIVYRTMWEVVCYYEIENGMMYDVGCGML